MVTLSPESVVWTITEYDNNRRPCRWYNRDTGQTSNSPSVLVRERSVLEASTTQNINVSPVASSAAALTLPSSGTLQPQVWMREADKWFSFENSTGRMVYINRETGEKQHAKPDCKKKYSARW